MGQSSTLLDDIYRMLAAGARAVERPQAAYRGKASANVESFLNKVRSLPGHQGYALTLHSPVPVEIGGQTDMGDEYRVPFSRQATHKLAEALGRMVTVGAACTMAVLAVSLTKNSTRGNMVAPFRDSPA